MRPQRSDGHLAEQNRVRTIGSRPAGTTIQSLGIPQSSGVFKPKTSWCLGKGGEKISGLVRDLNPGPLAPKARIIPLDQRADATVAPGACPWRPEIAAPPLDPGLKVRGQILGMVLVSIRKGEEEQRGRNLGVRGSRALGPQGLGARPPPPLPGHEGHPVRSS